MSKPRTGMLCACCAGHIPTPLTQFHNQDTGFALCVICAEFVESREGPEYLRETYGERGVNIEGDETNARFSA